MNTVESEKKSTGTMLRACMTTLYSMCKSLGRSGILTFLPRPTKRRDRSLMALSTCPDHVFGRIYGSLPSCALFAREPSLSRRLVVKRLNSRDTGAESSSHILDMNLLF